MGVSKNVIRVAVGAAMIGLGTLAYESRDYWTSAPPSSIPQPRTGRELLMVFIGSENCAPSKEPGFNKIVQRIATQVEAASRARGVRLVTIGIALSASPAQGLEFLADFGPFDEAFVGRGWMNSGAVNYVWRDLPGTSAVPQLVFLERDVSVTPRGIAISPDSLVLRIAGVDQIKSWQAAGRPLK